MPGNRAGGAESASKRRIRRPLPSRVQDAFTHPADTRIGRAQVVASCSVNFAPCGDGFPLTPVALPERFMSRTSPLQDAIAEAARLDTAGAHTDAVRLLDDTL